jgi:hypothetical protein
MREPTFGLCPRRNPLELKNDLVTWTKLYDETRVPSHWTELVRPGQYAVFLFDARSHAPRGPAGDEAGAIALCDGLTEALAFARETVAARPAIGCEIYDHEGKAKQPVEVVYNEQVRRKYHSLSWAKRETLGGTVLFFGGASLAAYDAMRGMAWIWGYIIGLKLMVIGTALLVRGAADWCERRAEQ